MNKRIFLTLCTLLILAGCSPAPENAVVLLPVYGDANDSLAVKIIGGLYTTREIVPIDVTPLYRYGGMLHCVTQQPR